MIFVSIAALTLLARLGGPSLYGFDGSVVVHHVDNMKLTSDSGDPIVIGPSAKGSIVILGYTRCPDECPLTLARVATALASLSETERPKALFVTVDPGHDDPTTLHRYLRAWNNRVTGVTGEIADLRRFYIAIGSNDPESRYVNHDTRIFVLNTNGDVIQELSPEASPDEIRASVWNVLRESKKQ